MTSIYILNGRKYETTKTVLTGKEILEIADLTPVEEFELLLKIQKKDFEYIRPDESVDLSQPEIEHFQAKRLKAVHYEVNDVAQETLESELTVSEILTKAGFSVSEFFLKELRGGKEISYENDPDVKIRIRNGMKFLACKEDGSMIILVNSRPKEWSKPKITFDEVVILAFGTISTNPRDIYTVTYRKGPRENPQGVMVKGDIVCVTDKMEFHVAHTNKS
ncbi:MAG: multiubiquitin domain-containing protein [Flavobacteriales bacterium]|nr:multiubiquitin domain-containing protein [Flavobacteriales bacterium]